MESILIIKNLGINAIPGSLKTCTVLVGVLICGSCWYIFLGTDECQSNPCENGGSCVDLHLDYKCNCTAGFEGKNCSTSE